MQTINPSTSVSLCSFKRLDVSVSSRSNNYHHRICLLPAFPALSQPATQQGNQRGIVTVHDNQRWILGGDGMVPITHLAERPCNPVRELEADFSFKLILMPACRQCSIPDVALKPLPRPLCSVCSLERSYTQPCWQCSIPDVVLKPLHGPIV